MLLRDIYNGLLSRPQTVYVTVILLLGGLMLGDAGEECAEEMELMFRAEMCLTILDEPTNGTFQKGLTEEAWQTSCTLYNKTTKCVEDVFNKCPELAAQSEVGELITSGLRDGLGKLCENDETFNSYMKHAECYARQEPGTVKCMNMFLNSIEAMHHGNVHDTTKHMCRSFKMLISCVNTIIGTNCGDGASALFESIVRMNVPSQITSACVIPEEQRQHRDSPASAAPAATILLTRSIGILLTIFSLLLCAVP